MQIRIHLFTFFSPHSTVKVIANKVGCKNGVRIVGEPLYVILQVDNITETRSGQEFEQRGNIYFKLLDLEIGEPYNGRAIINYSAFNYRKWAISFLRKRVFF